MQSSEWVSKLFDNGVALAVLFFLSWFSTMKLWPFFTGQMWPAWLEQAKERQKSEEQQTNALVKLETTQQLMVTLLERQVEMLWKLALTLAGVKPDLISLVEEKAVVENDKHHS